MKHTIPASAAGRFFPAEAGPLRREIDAYLAAAQADCRPKAIIAPHAAYGYSGRFAACAYKAVQAVADHVQRVLLLGTCHSHAEFALATTSADAMATPLGDVPVDREVVNYVVASMRGVAGADDRAQKKDHSLQTQLPFLQVVLPRFTVAPFLVGMVDDADVVDLIVEFGKPAGTLVVVSSDLSHHLDYDECNRVDRATADAILTLDASSVGFREACGYIAVRGLIGAAQRLHWTSHLLALKNSGDVTGDRSCVVGYGAFAFESQAKEFPEAECVA